MRWLSGFWNWFKTGWRVEPYADLKDKEAGLVFKKEWNDPSEKSSDTRSNPSHS